MRVSWETDWFQSVREAILDAQNQVLSVREATFYMPDCLPSVREATFYIPDCFPNVREATFNTIFSNKTDFQKWRLVSAKRRTHGA